MKNLMKEQAMGITIWSGVSRKTLTTLALISTAILCAMMNAAAQTKSKGVYRIPFESGTTVKIGNDFLTHKPLGRIDMSGTGGSNYKIAYHCLSWNFSCRTSEAH